MTPLAIAVSEPMTPEPAGAELGGAGRAASGPPILLLGPSLGTSAILWETAARALAEHWRVMTWDLPGHGASPATDGPLTVEDIADGLAAAVRLHDSPVIAAGVSLGGAVSLMLALRHPDLVRGVAAIASGATLGEPTAWHERARIARERSTSSLVSASAERWFAPGSIAREPVLAGRLLHALQAVDDESYAGCCEALAAYDVRPRLASIAVPVLALWGEHDVVAPEPYAAAIAAGAQRGTAACIDGAGHLPPAEQPDAVVEALRSWIAGIGDAGRHGPVQTDDTERAR